MRRIVFLVLLCAFGLVMALDIAFLAYLFVSLSRFFGGVSFLENSTLFEFSLATSIINGLLVVFAVCYYLFCRFSK